MRSIRQGQRPPPEAGRIRAIRWNERARTGALEIDTALYDYLRSLARAGLPRPSIADMARRWNRSGCGVSAALSRLELRGRIRRLPGVVVEIVDTGERTAARPLNFRRSAQQDRVVQFFADCARSGLEAPSIRAIGHALEISPRSALTAVAALVRRGHLRHHGNARCLGHSVEIVATGERTKPTGPKRGPAGQTSMATLRKAVTSLAARVAALEQRLGKDRHG